nr:Single-stranded DNA-binding protein [Escherichia coli]
MHILQNFCPEAGKLCGLPRQSSLAVAVMPHAAKVLKQVMVNTEEQRQVPANVKTAAPETQQMMGLKTRERKQDEYRISTLTPRRAEPLCCQKKTPKSGRPRQQPD